MSNATFVPLFRGHVASDAQVGFDAQVTALFDALVTMECQWSEAMETASTIEGHTRCGQIRKVQTEGIRAAIATVMAAQAATVTNKGMAATDAGFTSLFDGHVASDDDLDLDMVIDGLFSALVICSHFYRQRLRSEWSWRKRKAIRTVMQADQAALRAALATLTRKRAAKLKRGEMA